MTRLLPNTIVLITLLLGINCYAQKKVAILPTSTRDGVALKQMEASILRGAMQSKFSSNVKFEPLTRTNFEGILEEYNFQSSGLVDDIQRTQIGNLSGADYICTTYITKDQEYIYLEASLINVETGRITGQSTVFSKITGQYYDLLNNSAGELIEELIKNDVSDMVSDSNLVIAKRKAFIHSEQYSEEEEAIPFQLVEEKPSFQGGDANAFSKWVNAHLAYPEIAKENGVQGRITTQFSVFPDGRVGNVRVLKGVDPSLDKEAIRVISLSPRWKPGKQRDRTVKVTYTFPVNFQLW